MNSDRQFSISVIIPVYNGQAYLGPAIESVLIQKYRPLEIIVIDDGSTDSSVEVARRFGDSVRSELQMHQGIGAARNRGVELASGEWIAFLDADDLWVEDKLTWQMQAIKREPELDAVFGYVRQFISPELDEEQAKRIYCPPNPMAGYSPSVILIRRKAFLRVGLFDPQWELGEWIDWHQRAKEIKLKMLMLPQVLALRRLHRSNQSVRMRDSRIELVRILKAGIDRRRKS